MSVVKVGLKFIDKWRTDLEKQVCKYEEENAPKGQIVFYGPSNFTRWGPRYGMTPLREAVVGKSGAPCCINRGFGSTCAEHHLYYYDRMVKALEPKVLVYSPGVGNGTGFGYTPEEQWQLAERVMIYAKTDFPDLKIYLQGINMWRKSGMASWKTDQFMRAFAQEMPDCTYLDITSYEPLHRTDIYAPDNVHYNKEGYDLYAEYYRQALKEELDQF